jgi:chromosome segregation ATPase
MSPLGEVNIDLNSSFSTGDHCRATNEIVALRNELCKMRVRCEELEQERNYTAAKVNELQEIVCAFKSDDVHETLMKKSLQVAEISMEVDSLHVKIKKLAAENQQLKNAREADKSIMLDLSGMVKSLQCISFDSDQEEDDEEEEEVEILTAEKALDMTLRNMKYQVEGLEDERQRLSGKCKTQSNTIVSLTNDNELLGTKVEMLEEVSFFLLFWEPPECASPADHSRDTLYLIALPCLEPRAH